MNEKAIIARSLKKDFKLPHQKINSIKNVFTGIFSRGNRTFEIQHSLRGVSFEVEKGEFFGIVGRNGSGKSTLLKILASIYQPTRGTIYTNGRIVPFIELGVGFNPDLTGRENVYLNGALLGFSEDEIDKMYDNIVEFAELERFMDQKLKNYSSGMQVRLAFSMAIQSQADILLVDEVLAVGDADFQRKCFDYFQELKRKKVTVIFVTHDMAAVREYCDRAILIENGVVADEGDAERVAQSYTQLFQKSSNSSEGETGDKKRWGSREVRYSGTPVIEVVKNQITIEATAEARADGIDDIVLGFTVLGMDGQGIMGTNTRVKGKKIELPQKGDKTSVRWQFPNILEDGKYHIALTAHGTTGLPVYDWWNQAAEIDVRKNERTGYKINPEIKLKVADK